MANHCWNNVTITAKPDVLAKLEVLFNDYENHDYFVEWANTFFPNIKAKPTNDEYLFYGTRWWEFDCNMISDGVLEISGDSAWGPPEELIRMISEYYKVGCEIIFSESGMDFAGKRIWQNGELIGKLDQTYSEHVYEEGGMTSLIDNYLYDENCLEYYPSVQDFIDKMGIDPTDEELDIVKDHFKELKTMGKQEIINDLQEIETHLKNLSMYGLSKKVENILDILSTQWSEELKEKENE